MIFWTYRGFEVLLGLDFHRRTSVNPGERQERPVNPLRLYATYCVFVHMCSFWGENVHSI